MIKELKADYLFEVSWEVCNKVGGIYTVVATKALYLSEEIGKHHILIGPDLGVGANLDFVEDYELYKSWKQKLALEGLSIRIGHWDIPGYPIAILVNFKNLAYTQDEILTNLWLNYGVDSLSGNDDYKQSVLFAHVSAMLIESFYKHILDSSQKVVAQFHEWQTGAGVLYLKSKKLPIATVFTTHATVMGRCIAGNNLPLYDELLGYNADQMAHRFNVVALQSLEKQTALNADVFTTVSDLTARECKQFLGREVDIVTPNGFEPSFTPNTEEQWDKVYKQGRERIVKVASAMSDKRVSEDDLFIAISGRYEYRNKGIDVFIDALGRLQEDGYKNKNLHAFILIPSGHYGPDKNLESRLYSSEQSYKCQVSHYLTNPEYDQISRRLHELSLVNAQDSMVNVYFIPSYLNGNDGIFNMPYYDLLPAFDYAVFPSYYEPWGYTPLEALAFRVPTLTTSLAGFGLWVDDYYKEEHKGIKVIHRDDKNYNTVVEAVADSILSISKLSTEELREYRLNARKVSCIALWQNQLDYYMRANSMALNKIERDFHPNNIEQLQNKYDMVEVNNPSWKSLMVTRSLPEKLRNLEVLSKNLWWCWNEKAKALFKEIDPQIWHESGHNPMEVLDRVSLKRFNELAEDSLFLAHLSELMAEFQAYMDLKKERKEPSVAYFCMEYGLDTSLKIYSGGLGILAGDYLKETSDMNVNLCAVGFLYRYGYFNQSISSQGDQVANYDAQDFLRLPIEPVYDKEGNWCTTSVAFPGRDLTARIWKVAVGRTDLYLLDTDFEANIDEDRQVTHHLYGGDWENRLKQELLLGIGGIKALRKLGLNPTIYHCNEGHAAFIGLERLREYIQNDNLSYGEALELVRASSLFTTHTPVPAGHDEFDEGLLRKYLGAYPEALKISWETMMGLGKLNGSNVHEKFSVSILAANISQNINGVSMLHGKVSQDIFSNMYPGYLPEELHITYVTNGVHYPTWTAREWKAIHSEVFGEAFKTYHYDKSCFEGIYKIEDERIWTTRKRLKKVLFKEINERLSNQALGNYYSPSEIVTIKERLSKDILTIGFARRFATYKRACLLFNDLDRLDAIVNNPKRPMQFIFAGKAHPADKAGQDLIKAIVNISKDERFLGRIVFVPGYDISLAKRMVQGVDVWMNNPTRPLEASGTSGEKAAMNGVMHFSVLDGWWVEGYKERAGWALPQERTYDDQNYQNELDAATIYATLENDIAPLFYDLDSKTEMPTSWIEYIKNTVAQVACNFTTNRMLSDYVNQYYTPQSERYEQMIKDNFALAKELAEWKSKVEREWPAVSLVSYKQPDSSYSLTQENALSAEVVLNIANLEPDEVGVEILFATTDKKGRFHIQDKSEFKLQSCKDSVAVYKADITPDRRGMYQVATRIYAKNAKLPHRQDFALVRWL